MKFTVETGNKEKSKIEFSRNGFTGAMVALVDGQRVAQQSPLSLFTHFSFVKKRRYEFSVGKAETHKVVLEKERPWLVAGFRRAGHVGSRFGRRGPPASLSSAVR